MAHDDDKTALPFPLSDVSNGEWIPRPPTRKQRAVAELIHEEADKRARRLDMSRRDFLRTAAGTATAFMCMNLVYGLPSTGEAAVLPVTEEQCSDPRAANALFEADEFVMDVQLHHVDLEVFGDVPGLGCLRFLPESETCTPEGLQNLSQANMIKEVFVDSETAVGVISGVPDGVPLPVETMAATRDMVNQLAGSTRALSQAMCDPRTAPGTQTAIDSLEHQVNDLGACALKCYTGNDLWWLDDEDVAYPMLAECERLGIDVINVHKGFPNLLGPGSAEYVRSRDFPKVLEDWPHMRFVAYHSGWFPGEGNEEFRSIVRGLPHRSRRRMYAEIGSSFAVTFLESPLMAARFVGELMRDVGANRILWGTDSIWWGSPQWQVDAFKTLQIPRDMRRELKLPKLTKTKKRRILGRNAAKLYHIKVREKRCEIAADQITQIKAEQGGVRASRSHLVYGPRTREAFEALLAHNGQQRRRGDQRLAASA
jgi:predicted TIM-barrel fold metal-dependent hydrolase